MKHNKHSTTHWACNEKLAEEGQEATCCGCDIHECKYEEIQEFEIEGEVVKTEE